VDSMLRCNWPAPYSQAPRLLGQPVCGAQHADSAPAKALRPEVKEGVRLRELAHQEKIGCGLRVQLRVNLSSSQMWQHWPVALGKLSRQQIDVE
jgi:hypothetical protein